MRRPRTLADVKRDPRVVEVWQEDDGARFDGRPSWWAALAPGYNFDGVSTLHEPTIKDLCAALERVEEGEPY